MVLFGVACFGQLVAQPLLIRVLGCSATWEIEGLLV